MYERLFERGRPRRRGIRRPRLFHARLRRDEHLLPAIKRHLPRAAVHRDGCHVWVPKIQLPHSPTGGPPGNGVRRPDGQRTTPDEAVVDGPSAGREAKSLGLETGFPPRPAAKKFPLLSVQRQRSERRVLASRKILSGDGIVDLAAPAPLHVDPDLAVSRDRI